MKHIGNELQNIAETIKAITGVDVTIVDNNLKRIAGTGVLKDKIGGYVPKNSAFEKSLISGRQYLIIDPSTDDLCVDCHGKDTCKEKLELCIPIKIDNKIIGILGMCIFDDKTKLDFISKQEDFKNFESRLSSLISTKINEEKLGVIVEYRSSELMTLINSLNEGIIILNNNKAILSINKYMKDRLNISNVNPYANISDILPLKIVKNLAERSFNGEIGPITIEKNKFLINASPIIVKGKKQGVVLVFSDFDKMQESVLNASKISGIVTFDDIIGESEAIKYVKSQAIQIAEKDISVLLLGESGTGKEVFARAIHFSSRRKNDVFMPINCGAIPENLIESELFGYEKGSFTGANVTGKIGKFELAKDGTIFLDEIGDLPLHMQVKLLRVLEEKEFMRVGGYTNIKINPRIISATHKNLHNMVLEKRFREDLFYRLNVVPIVIPPLRERGYDIIILAKYFLNKYNNIYNKDIKGFTLSCEQALLSYSFPGNIRELKNLIEYAVNFESKDYIDTETINKKWNNASIGNVDLTLSEMTKTYEKKIIKDYLNRYGNDLNGKKIIAEKLGISIATLYRKIDEN
ncbi:MAG: sigma 54-interacting transcriptional regulator [Clostridiaceae bacterium]